MRILFADFSPMRYTAETPWLEPLGGTQSAACYLAIALADRGHEVWLCPSATDPGIHRGVVNRSLGEIGRDNLETWRPDAVIVINSPRAASAIRGLLPPSARLVLWTTHATDQADVRPLAEDGVRRSLDGIVYISQWQRREYERDFGAVANSTVLPLAVAPPFLEPGLDEKSFAGKVAGQMAYTSTPFRGLDVLVAVFPLIREHVASATLRVFSSLAVYQTRDPEPIAELYEHCRRADGIEYVGSLAQPELAQALRSATLWAYPNTFAETGCVAAMEALASGLLVVTSDKGALPETLGGFGQLVPWREPVEDFAIAFAERVVGLLRWTQAYPEGAAERVAAQLEFVRSTYSWPKRVLEWEAWLRHIA